MPISEKSSPSAPDSMGSTAEYWDARTPGPLGVPNDDATPPLRNSLASIVSALASLPAWAGVLATDLSDARIVFRKPPPFPLGERVPGRRTRRSRSATATWIASGTGSRLR